jgi:hypothetical protein
VSGLLRLQRQCANNEKPARWKRGRFLYSQRKERVMSEAISTPETISRQQAKLAGKTRYFTGKPCKNGHVETRLVSNGICGTCVAARKRANRNSINIAQRKHRAANRDRWRDLSKSHYWRHVEKNREKAKARARAKAALKPKRQVKYKDPIQRGLANRMRCRMWQALKQGKGRSLESVLGYSIEMLKQHIERQFAKGMSWDNWSDWHIDHIVPVTAFHFSSYDDPEFRACWALTNLRPLWEEQNRKKSYYRTHLI